MQNGRDRAGCNYSRRKESGPPRKSLCPVPNFGNPRVDSVKSDCLSVFLGHSRVCGGHVYSGPDLEAGARTVSSMSESIKGEGPKKRRELQTPQYSLKESPVPNSSSSCLSNATNATPTLDPLDVETL